MRVLKCTAATLAVITTLALGSPSDVKAETLPLGTISHLAWEAANRYQLPEGAAYRLVCIAWYESTFRTDAVSPAGHTGLLQFSSPTWAYYSKQIGYSGELAGARNPTAAFDTAAYLISVSGRWTHWTPVIDGRC